MVIIKKYYKIELYDILAVPKLNNMARAYSTLVVLVFVLLAPCATIIDYSK